MKKIITGIFFLLLSFTTYAQVTIDDTSTRLRHFTIEYFYDESKQMGIDDVAGKSFFKEIPSQFTLGYKEGNAWFKIEIKNKSNKNKFILNLTEVFWSEVDAYQHVNGEWQEQKNGLNVPVKNRSVKVPSPAFLITLEPNQQTTVYVKGNSVSGQIGEFRLYTEEEFFSESRITILEAFTTYQVMLIVIFILVSYVFYIMRERVYFYYLAYVLSFIVWVSVQSGLYLNLGIPGWKDALHALGGVFVFFLVMFSKHVLELQKNAPVAKMMFDFSAWVIGMCVVAIIIQIPYTNLFFNIFSSFFFTGLVVVAIKAWNKSYFKLAKLYLIALVIYMPTMAMMTLSYNGFISNQDITRYAYVGGSIVEILIFSFILLRRYQDKMESIKNQL